MALPVIVTGLESAIGNILNITEPFISSTGNVYVFGKGTTATLLRAFKATDPTSSFSNVGSDITVNNTIRAVQAFQVDDVIHVLSADSSGSTVFDLKYHTFDMSTDAWVITNELILDDDAVGVTATTSQCDIAVRDDGDVIVLYNGNRISSLERVYYARREAGVWTIDILVDNGGASQNWYAGSIVKGSSDRMHFFFINDTAADAYQRTLTSANVLESFPAAYDTSVNSTQIAQVRQGVAYLSGGATKVRYPSSDSTTANVTEVAFDSADAPTVSVSADITGTRSVDSGACRSAFCADETTLWHVLIDTLSDIYTQSNVDGAGWDTPALFATEASAGIKVNVYSRAGRIVIGMMYNDGSNPTYNEMDLRADGGTVQSAFTSSVTWGGRSTATSAMNPAATASVTWNGRSFAASRFDQDATASVTWTGAGVIITASAFSSTAVASVTWNGAIVSAGAFSAVETASLTWNGRSFASANFNAPAAASLTWNGVSIAASAFNDIARAVLVWNGTSIAASSLSLTPAATLTWNGEEVVSASASAEWSSTAAADLIWDGASSATADLSSTAVASVTWNGTGIFPGAFSAAAQAVQTWNATGIASADWSAIAAASLLWNGASIASNAWSSASIATLTWNGTATISADWLAAPAALLVWEGEGQGGPTIRAGAWSAIVSATVEFDSSTIVEAGFDCRTTATLRMNGKGPGALRSEFLDGPRKRFRPNQDNEDFIFIAAALGTLEQDHDYY